MTQHFQYARYLFRHKWFVFVACLRRGMPLVGLLHDWSKFMPSEWRPYAEYLYNKALCNAETLDAMARFGVAELAPFGFYARDRFTVAWNIHQKRNRHHWQFWLITKDTGETYALPMPMRYIQEMLADWEGASRAQKGVNDIKAWYSKNRSRIILHADTRVIVDGAVLGRIDLEDACPS